MRKLFILVLLSFSFLAFSQGMSISLKKKTVDPVTLSSGSVLKVGDIVYFQTGLNPDGSFRFVQDLNNFNEPIQPSKSRTSMMKQPVKFFKEADGVVYAFTKFFVVNVEAALKSKEIEIISAE